MSDTMNEGIMPAIYEVSIGWDAANLVTTVYAITYTLEDALKGANGFIAKYPWPAAAPEVIAIRMLCNAEHVVISNRLFPET